MTGLSRIWEAAAYGPEPPRDCWWAEDVPPGDWPALAGAATAEVAVIGAGFTGLSAALRLAEAGADVAVLEAEHPFWGASGRNGGFCCLGGAKAGHAAIAARFGLDAARAYARTERAAVDFVDALIARLGLDVERHSTGETRLAHRPRDLKALRAQQREVQDLYGVTATLLAREDLPRAGMTGPFHGALTTPIGFALNPRKYAAGLAHAARDAGAAIHGQSAVTTIDPAPGGYVLRTARGRLAARRVILATNGYSAENLPAWMAGRYLPAQSSVIVTRPMSDTELAAQGWTSRQMCYDTRHLLHYFRLMPDHRMLFGMRGGLARTPRAETAIRARVRADFDAFFPAWRGVGTPHYWSGLVCLTRDLLPYAGPIPGMEGAFAGFGYHGNGVAMGSHAGAVLADLALGRAPDRPWPAPMRHVPRRFPLGRYRRALLRPAYLGYGLADL